jgi:hypothetical protein
MNLSAALEESRSTCTVALASAVSFNQPMHLRQQTDPDFS